MSEEARDPGERRWFVWHGILFEEPNPTGSRPSDLIGIKKTATRHINGGSETEVRETSVDDDVGLRDVGAKVTVTDDELQVTVTSRSLI